jgi:phosphatidylglycerophosphatase A
LLYIIVGVALFFIGIFIADRLSKIWGDDPRMVVIDEFATFLLPLYFTPKRFFPLAVSFILFRLFDIIKPPPIRRLEKLPGGWGIMLDDLLAAVFTTVIIIFIHLLGVKL